MEYDNLDYDIEVEKAGEAAYQYYKNTILPAVKALIDEHLKMTPNHLALETAVELFEEYFPYMDLKTLCNQ